VAKHFSRNQSFIALHLQGKKRKKRHSHGNRPLNKAVENLTISFAAKRGIGSKCSVCFLLTVFSLIYVFSVLVMKVVWHLCPEQACKFHLQIVHTCENAIFADVGLPWQQQGLALASCYHQQVQHCCHVVTDAGSSAVYFLCPPPVCMSDESVSCLQA